MHEVLKSHIAATISIFWNSKWARVAKLHCSDQRKGLRHTLFKRRKTHYPDWYQFFEKEKKYCGVGGRSIGLADLSA
jgi:hypothetical protein